MKDRMAAAVLDLRQNYLRHSSWRAYDAAGRILSPNLGDSRWSGVPAGAAQASARQK